MTKVNRREAVGALLGLAFSVGALTACQTVPPDELPKPRKCVWLVVPYSFACLTESDYRVLNGQAPKEGEFTAGVPEQGVTPRPDPSP
jgi:hypothetical protein